METSWIGKADRKYYHVSMNSMIHGGMLSIIYRNRSSNTTWSTIDIPTDSQLTHIFFHTAKWLYHQTFCLAKVSWQAQAYLPLPSPLIQGQAIVPPELALPKVQGKQVFFFGVGLILWCNQSGNNPQKDLDNFFVYKLNMEIKYLDILL
jgi:hypothetical protein